MKASFLRRAWWLHPMLLGAFPLLFLFASNIREQITLEPLLGPLAIAVGATGGLVVATAVVAKIVGSNPARAGLIASLLLTLFFSYGHVWQAVEEALRLHRFLLLAWAAVAAMGIVVIVRARIDRVLGATSILNGVALILVGLNLVPIAQFQLSAPASASTEMGTNEPEAGVSAERGRDVWYLVFDRYAGQEALTQIYGYDNSPFLDELEDRGFIIAKQSTANYLKTALSLASTLSMDYLNPEALTEEASAADDWGPLYRQLQGGYAVERFLRDRGYEYLHFGVRRGATYTNSEADHVYLYGDHTEFSAVLVDTTLLAALENIVQSDAPGGIAGLYANQSLYQFNTLELLATASSEAPRFIFAHFLLPHPPYVFNSDGTWVTPEQAAARKPDEEYLEQLRYTNRRVLDLLDTLLRRPLDERPIVLIQSDEGPFPNRYARDEEGFAWLDATDEELLEKFSILAAYHVPGSTPDELAVYPTVTPVNSFRLIFNAAFDADLSLLPDRNWIFVDQRHIYDMVDVTDRLAH